MMYDGVIDLLGVAGSYCSTRFLSSLCFSVVASIAVLDHSGGWAFFLV